MATMPANASVPRVSIVVPARNEEASLADCLRSLTLQTGVDFEIIVVNDHSIDRTLEIAASFGTLHPENIRVIEAGLLPPGWTGKNNAVMTGVREARGEWLLFTDADTIHMPGSLARALQEAEENQADMLSYSPEQIAVTFWEMAVLPVVFAELARHYPPSKVSDPNSPIAAANGQYILIKRDVYDAVGGHAAIAGEILEDVALARALKAAGRKIRFRYAADAVRARMYRNFAQLRDGWTKNLALLFPRPGWLAAKIFFCWVLPWAVLLSLPIAVALGARVEPRWLWMTVFCITGSRNVTRLRRANFGLTMEFLSALFGMPMFADLLLRSKRAHASHSVSWKGRTYAGTQREEVKTVEGAPKTAARLV